MIFLVLVGMPGFAQGEISIQASLNRDTIGLDEQAILTVLVAGSSQKLPRPTLPSLSTFEVYSQGQSSNVSISNNQVKASITYRYLLLPQEPGTYPIAKIFAVHKGRRYESNTVTVTVLNRGTAPTPQLGEGAKDGRGSTKDYFLEAHVDNKSPFVNQQVTLTLKFFIAVQYYRSPELTEPTTTGFWTEVLGNKAPYHQRVDGRTYKVIERKYALFPTQTGSLTIGQAIITATVASRSRQRRDPFDVFGMFGGGRRVSVRSRPIRINVQRLPDKGRPANYTGTIGRFTISAKANKTEVEVNQPVTVRIDIRGSGNIKSVAEPVIPDLPDFRVYKASSNESVSKSNDKIGGTKSFEEVFIPNRTGDLEIPSLEFNFFNPEKKKYQSIRTRPIRLKVLKGEGYASDINLPYSSPDVTIGAESRDIRFIKAEPGDMQPMGELLISSPTFLAVNALPVMFLISTIVVRRRREKLAKNVGYARSRSASRMARKRLARAKKLADIATTSEFYTECSQAVISYVADKMNMSVHGLTSDRIADLMNEHHAEPQLVDDTLKFLNRCSFARYTPSAANQTDIAVMLEDAEALMVRIEGVRFD